MCGSKPSVPAATPVPQQEVTAPTQADAAVSKASSAERNKQASLAGRDIKTTPRGLADTAVSKKKQLLGE